MADRFLMLASRDAGVRATVLQFAEQRELRIVRNDAGLLILCSADAGWQSLVDGKCLIVGSLFAKSNFQPTKLDDAFAGKDGCPAFEVLLDRYWGRYVALSLAEDTVQILRDPSGGLPAYHLECDRYLAAASDAKLLVEAGLLQPVIDHDSILQQFRQPNGRLSATGLCGLRELMPGYALEWQGQRATEKPLWSPWSHARRRFYGDFEQAARQLRETVDGCIKALGRRENGATLIGMSGGLDSSIIAAALREVDFGAEGISIATKHPDGDERHYARQICSRLGLPFHGAQYDVSHVDPLRPSAPHLARPTGEGFLQSYDRIVMDLARERGARSIFRGNGGDAVFCFMQNVMPILDRWEAKHERRNIMQTVSDVCRMTDSDMRAVLKASWEKKRGSPLSSMSRVDDLFLSSRDVDRSLPAVPGEEQMADLPRGRIVHALWILRVQRFTEGYARDGELEMICPLLSQPIVELCLSIPSWYWIEGGINRAVARQAYRPILGPEAMQRTRKGGPAAFCVDLLEAYRQSYRELLLDGLLARHEVIDRNAVEAALAYEGPQRGDGYLRLLALADAEAWVRHWSGAGAGRLSTNAGMVAANAGSSHLLARDDA
ncbi:asparagine synthase-related protein [Sphingobium olei]|uniref:asparagine synthase (glutamine-hydrolyzing) n=1 Tax=Sphingobium olei TaxID=420955 RepID=A0ABW3NX08_9SPHN